MAYVERTRMHDIHGLALTNSLCIAYVKHTCMHDIHGLGTNWTSYV